MGLCAPEQLDVFNPSSDRMPDKVLPRVPAQMKLPVTVYTLVITGMLLCAGLSAGLPAAQLIIVGAWGFAISDLAVARRQFIHPSRWNGLWGTPLYFLSQMLLAASIAFV